MLDNLLHLLTYHPDEPLFFSSGLFLVLFLVLSLAYMLCRRRTGLRELLVVLFSVYFYYKSSGAAVLVLLTVTLSDYLLARAIDRSRSRALRRTWLLVSIGIDMGLLAFFKYAGDILHSSFFILHSSFFIHPSSFILPVGISFYTFRSLSYTVDVYRRQLPATRSLLDYAFYVTFFPVLLAGPINRAVSFLPQIHRRLRISPMMLAQGTFLIAVGLLKKAVVSDYISLNFVDRVFDNPTLFSGGEVLLAIYGYCLQIYCDFSGYSDMAIGLALWLGFRLPENFRQPFLADSFSEFWRRWHITLSQWIRDYVYIPLGGSRHGRLRTFLSQMVAMVLCGLWHGASLTFLLWGALHGLLVCLHKFFSQTVMRHDRHYHPQGWRRVVAVVVTFHVLCLTWLPFRLNDLRQVWLMLHQLVTKFHAALLPDILLSYRWVFLLMVAGFAAHLVPLSVEQRLVRRLARGGVVAAALLLVVVIVLVIQVKSSAIQPFIYFQF